MYGKIALLTSILMTGATAAYAGPPVEWDDETAYFVAHKIANATPAFEKLAENTKKYEKADQFDKADVKAAEMKRLQDAFANFKVSDSYSFKVEWRLSEYNSFNNTFSIDGVRADSRYTWSKSLCSALYGCGFKVCVGFTNGDEVSVLAMDKDKARDFYKKVKGQEKYIPVTFTVDSVKMPSEERDCDASVKVKITSAKLYVRSGAPIMDLAAQAK